MIDVVDVVMMLLSCWYEWVVKHFIFREVDCRVNVIMCWLPLSGESKKVKRESSVSVVKSVSLVLLSREKKSAKMSSESFNFESLESVLSKNLKENELSEVKRVLYGRSNE